MRHLVTDEHRNRYDEFRAFVATDVEPYARDWDRDQRIPRHVITRMGERGYFGCTIPRSYEGRDWDVVTLGLLHEAFGRGSSALTDVLTVQAMVAMTLLKWGSAEQKERWLPELATGAAIGAFAITEPGVGSNIRGLEAEFTRRNGGFDLTGTKKWISAAQVAGVFVVFGHVSGEPMACVLPRDAAGLRIEPICDLLGFRAAGLAILHFDGVHVPESDVIGRPGFATSHVAPVGLHYGRISTACSALGLLRACFEESAMHASRRAIGSQTVGDLGMIRSLIARMGTDLAAAGSLCHDACSAEQAHLPSAYEAAMVAKHFTTRAVARAASDAVQILGAAGCHESSPVARYYRDAKITEIIEGTTQVHEDLLGRMFVDRAGGSAV